MKFWVYETRFTIPTSKSRCIHGAYEYCADISSVFREGRVVGVDIKDETAARLVVKKISDEVLVMEVMEWEDESCSCHMGHPPCSKCMRTPTCEYHDTSYIDCNCHNIADSIEMDVFWEDFSFDA